MPHLLLHRHSRAPRRRAAAPVAAAAIALAGCTSAAPSTPGPSTVAGAVQITGAESTFAAPFFTATFATYQQARLDAAVSYAAVGSSAGITRFAAGQVGFGATDVPASPADPVGATGTTVQVPVDLGANVVHRSDGSGTTYILSDYLSSVSAAWAAAVGTRPVAALARRHRR
jgi:phosphate transport system substrate-binding protein